MLSLKSDVLVFGFKTRSYYSQCQEGELIHVFIVEIMIKFLKFFLRHYQSPGSLLSANSIIS
jgi:hypothetical protein